MEVKKKDLQSFGFIWVVIFFFVFLYFYFFKNIINYYFIFISFGFLFISLINAFILYPFYFIWIKFGNIIGWINTRIIMVFLFYFIFTPIGILLKLFGKDLLKKKIDKNTESYWIKREEQINSMKYQF